MPSYHYEPLSAQDTAFLQVETANTPMHVANLQLLEAGPLATPDGGIDVDAIRRFTSSVLHRIPRYRQRLAWTPLERSPVWVDDPDFRIDHHIRHLSLPRPGDDAQLRELLSRLEAQPLDRGRPLWEIWVIEGLAGDRFGMLSKIHHCMIDGASGVNIAEVLQTTTPDRTIHEAPPYRPRPAPTGIELYQRAWRRRLSLPFRALRTLQELWDETEDPAEELIGRASAIGSSLVSQLRPSSQTPINGELGPHRSFDWMRTSLDDVKAIRRGLGCTVNDVVLTVLTGAFRDTLQQRGVAVGGLDFRAQTPVSVRSEAERELMGNRFTAWLVPLPLDESDPRAQLARIHAATQELKESRQALGADLLIRAVGEMPTGLLSLGVQAISPAMNTIVTNVPGPPFPLYLLGAELHGLYPCVPLFPNVGIGVALLSYNGSICWGFNADAELVPDLTAFTKTVQDAYARVAEAADVKPLAPTR